MIRDLEEMLGIFSCKLNVFSLCSSEIKHTVTKVRPARAACAEGSGGCPSMLMILFNHFQLAIQISKDGLPGRVPLWVILLSAFAGLLLLMLLILALWKVSTDFLFQSGRASWYNSSRFTQVAARAVMQP